MSLLKVESLKTYYYPYGGIVKAVDDVSLSMAESQILGIAGESGSGKTTLALSLMRIIPKPGRIMAGKIIFDGDYLLKKDERDMQRIRWKKISMIFQGLSGLDPLMSVHDQIAEPILIHEMMNKQEASSKVDELLELVGIDPSRADSYPHEFSGGMKQRVMIAMALACNPKLVIADEPTIALDVMVAAQILRLIKKLRNEFNLSAILVTHNLGQIAETCDVVVIMYAGKIFEFTDAKTFFKTPLHPYSCGLLAAFPSIRDLKSVATPIEGYLPDPQNPPSGCTFHPRCKYAKEICRRVEPELIEVDGKHKVACHLFN